MAYNILLSLILITKRCTMTFPVFLSHLAKEANITKISKNNKKARMRERNRFFA